VSLSEGLRRRVPLERMVDVTSTRAAKLFGLYPRKGTIRVGSDADLVVLDPTGGSVIDAATQHSAAEYTPWQGHEITPRIVHTLVRGTFALRDGRLTEARNGRFIPRHHSGAAALADADRPTQEES